jgi:Zn-dependent protease
VGPASNILLFAPILLFSVVIHEYAHARVALAEGDDTALMLGRVTLNPLRHIDPIGTVLVPLGLWAMQAGFLFGWARPVPVNPRNFRNYRRGDIRVSLAGVAANFGLAIVCTLVAIVLVRIQDAAGASAVTTALIRMARFGILFNLILGVFNLVPLPPLDGSHVLYHLLPPELGARYRELGRFSFVFLAAILFVPGLLDAIFYPVGVLMAAADRMIEFFA